MKITLATPTTMRLDFPYNAATVAFVKALGAQYEGKEARTWLLSVRHLRTVTDAYPQARIDKAVIEARYAMWKRLIRTLSGWGIEFAYAPDGALVCYPIGSEPEKMRDVVATQITPQTMLDFIASHTAQIAPWLAESIVEPIEPAATERAAVCEVVQAEVSHGDRLIMTGMRNAAKNEEKKAALVKRMQAKRWRGKQVEMEME